MLLNPRFRLASSPAKQAVIRETERMNPRISVIVPAYNAARFVAEAVESILNQTLAPMEIVVVNDGSTDDTEAILRPYRERIHYIRQQNRGLPAARNRGIEESQGDLIAFLDADDVWLPGKLEKQWKCFQDHPAAGLVHSNVLLWHDATGEKTPGYEGLRERTGWCYSKLFSRSAIIPSATMVKRECLDRVGLFNESMRTSEDYELFLRIARYYEFAYVDDPLILYRRHDSNMSKNSLLMWTNDLFIVRKALLDDPDLHRLVGRRRVQERLHGLLFSIGYLHHEAYRQDDARQFFLQALAHKPWHAYTLSLYLMNLLPSPWTRTLRQLKAKLS